jgi:hypothetical protein
MKPESFCTIRCKKSCTLASSIKAFDSFVINLSTSLKLILIGSPTLFLETICSKQELKVVLISSKYLRPIPCKLQISLSPN